MASDKLLELVKEFTGSNPFFEEANAECFDVCPHCHNGMPRDVKDHEKECIWRRMREEADRQGLLG